MTFPGLIQVANEYNLKALKAKSKEAKAKIIKENEVLEDLEAGIELVRGTYGLPADPILGLLEL